MHGIKKICKTSIFAMLLASGIAISQHQDSLASTTYIPTFNCAVRCTNLGPAGSFGNRIGFSISIEGTNTLTSNLFGTSCSSQPVREALCDLLEFRQVLSNGNIIHYYCPGTTVSQSGFSGVPNSFLLKCKLPTANTNSISPFSPLPYP